MTEQTYREHLNSLQVEIEALREKLKASQAGDLISRQAAIDAVNEYATIWMAYTDSMTKDEIAQEALDSAKASMIRIVKALPSAQPKIIRCKDCKFWLPHSQFGCDEDYGEYHDYCERLVPEDDYYAFYRDADEFCSRAERRTT